ncbi:Amino acid ABC transporter, fused permease and periplasmic binding protein [Nitrospina gracilis 3/211]|uniref:Glutamate/aspartate import permease protein GltK n=1 Tax=Nitrospina gracilis (strain 3/211) TaxID=1266370 RepID=M1YW51_NITG3|nr:MULTISPECIES: ABC transporter substrate-binding protein/permease [Nitrospina]MCF8722610.1 polar amino acid transport system substrate-binding protein [Nitrospina sp. Nb-3]CCQ89539.1 Amino acid ABC transporter, fused permease and periplasmic binding protein [Nitrospina gracilis 3/211]
MNPSKTWGIVLLWALLWGVPVHATGTLDTVREQGVLLWGADAEGGAPYVFPDPENPSRLIGFEVDLAQAIAHELGVTARMVQNDWSSLIPALQRGDFHMAMNGLEWTEERVRAVNLSRPYYIYEQQLVVRADDTRIDKLSDLDGMTVGTLVNSVAHSILKKMEGVTVRVYEGQVEPYRDLKLGRSDAVLLDLPIALHYAAPDPALRFAGPPVREGLYVIAVQKGDDAFLNAVNAAIGKLYDDGTLQSIYQKWNLWNDTQRALVEEDHTARRVFDFDEDQAMQEYLLILMKGAGMTVVISVLAMALAVVLGLVLTGMRQLGGPLLRGFAAAYIEIVRGTPLLLQLYIIYYGLPNIGIRLDAFTAAVVGLGMNYAAYEAEVYRGGLKAVAKGQWEAALSLGMTPFLIYRRILLPQAVRVVLPPVTNDFISLFKDTSLVSIIAIVELTKSYNMLAVSSMRFLELGLLTGLLYLMMAYPLSLLSTRLERRLQTA